MHKSKKNYGLINNYNYNVFFNLKNLQELKSIPLGCNLVKGGKAVISTGNIIKPKINVGDILKGDVTEKNTLIILDPNCSTCLKCVQISCKKILLKLNK